jgi:cytoskeletal protein RodZ
MSSPKSKNLASTQLNLPEERRKKGVSLQDIVQRTKITSMYLHAIESEQFQILPGCLYSVSYIKQYAGAIDYDAELILTVYREKVLTSEVLLAPLAIAPPRPKLLMWLWKS